MTDLAIFLIGMFLVWGACLLRMTEDRTDEEERLYKSAGRY
jgi:hypothetical protein